MRILLKGMLDLVKRHSGREDGTSMVNVELKGSVTEGHKGPDSKQADAHLQFHVKPVVLDGLDLGKPVYVIITDKNPEPES